MKYYMNKTTRRSFEETVEKVTDKLREEGFGIVSEIRMDQTMHNKLGKTMHPYIILGACHPSSAWEVLQTDERIGLLLPCNIVIRETEKGFTEVAAIHPAATMPVTDSKSLSKVAGYITEKLRNVVEDA